MAHVTRRSLRPGRRPLPAPDRGMTADIARQIAVGVAVLLMLAAALAGSGLFGGQGIAEAQGGALAPDATLLAPAGPAFSVWSLIYLGLIGYAVWQALPRQRASSRHRALGWWIAATAAVNALWVLCALVAPLLWTVVVIVVLLVLLVIAFCRTVLTRHVSNHGPSRAAQTPWLDAVLIDGVTGLHLGWVAVATLANTAALIAAGDALEETARTGWAIGMLVVVVIAGLVSTLFTRWRVLPALGMAWGAAWIGVERLAGEPHSVVVGVVALVVAGVLVVVPLGGRLVAVLGDGKD